MKIAQIRSIIQSLNWSRNDLGGSTIEEFKRCDVPARLKGKIEAVRSLDIPARFTKDIADQAWAIECAEKIIRRWESMQEPETISIKGEEWEIIGKGRVDESGKTYCHLLIKTIGFNQKNGFYPVQMCEWIDLGTAKH